MTASATKNGTSDNGASGRTPLVEGLKRDRPEDSRDCPHECHGSLTLTENERVICQSCRCTPDGVFSEPSESTPDQPRGLVSSARNPYPSHTENGDAEREWYSHSFRECSLTRVRMPGGFENVYDENDENRPDGVDDEYTWDLSTL